MYSGFRKHILNTFAAQIGEDVDKVRADMQATRSDYMLDAWLTWLWRGPDLAFVLTERA